ncbi:gliding motility-associated protein GldM [Chitinophaga sp. CF118]|uniref:type IX secretion system motor protein PorM/GldM n=1 Tax=Chitinophaga sp. CF118 TaxID=1884367 RepID=UPI0008F34DE9|nr:gliding motility protein GldM [Chitinophaga sp. CF118]SFD29948.1 gliding motility-associated protein GldM [Chitinophaga sp. CF118]
MALPKDPRQKMINIMYLVLTAMLALNVSAEILNAFNIVNNSIITSNGSITDKNNITYAQFEKQMAADAAKAAPFKEKADQVKKLSAEMYVYLDTLKETIIRESGGRNEFGDVKSKDNLDAPTRVMENRKQGPELEKRLTELRAKLLTYVDPKAKATFEKTLPLHVVIGKSNGDEHGPKNKTWTQYHFNMVPTIAAVTILSKFQNDIKNSESLIIDDLLAQISVNDFKFDKIRPFVSLNSKNLMEGQTLTASIAVGAYSSTVNPEIVVNGSSVTATEGLGTYTMPVSGIGEKTISGTVTLKKPNGEAESYPFSETYSVGASTTSISADKMNVLYIGLQNPISVSAGGVPAEKVSAGISAGKMTKTGAGQYSVVVSSPGKATISVSADLDGKVKTLGAKEFRIKYIPDPILKVGMSRGPSMKAAEFKVQGGLRADLEDFLFDGVRYEVVSYRIGIDAKGKDYVEGEANSAYFPNSVMGAIRSLRPGDQVYFDNVRVKGPDGRVRDMSNINFKIN